MSTYHPMILEAPGKIEDVVSILKQWGSTARIVAGNTTLFEFANQDGLADVERLVDIMNLGLSYVKEDENHVLHIGSTTTFREIGSLAFPYGKSHLAIKEVSLKITPPQIRNMATIGGAICSGIPFYDMPTVLLCLDSKMKVLSFESERLIDVDNFFVDYFITALNPDDLLVEVQIPNRLNAGSSFVKIGRTSVDFAVVNTSALIVLDEKRRFISDARIAMGAIANTPIRNRKAEEHLIGREPSDKVILEASSIPVDIEPMPTIHASSEYKKIILPVAVREAIFNALRRAEEVS